MRQVFRNIQMDESFKKDGYVILPQLINTNTRNKIIQFFNHLNLSSEGNMQLTGSITDTDTKANIHQFICETFSTSLNEVLINFEPIQGIFSNKPPHQDSAMCVHRDWNLVDESEYLSLSAWTLISGDSNMHGHLDVWPKSHLEFYTIRGRNFDFEVNTKQFSEKNKTIYIKEGDCIFFDHRIVHASKANLSNTDRLATVLAHIPREASLQHYYKDNLNQKIDILELHKESFHQLDFTKSDYPPNKRIIKSIPYSHE